VSSRVGAFASKVFNVAKVPFVSTALFVALCIKVIAAKVFYAIENVMLLVNDFIEFDPPDVLDIKDWRICVLDERELLDGGIVRYRFELANDNAVLPLATGQELVMCAVDARDKILKSSFYPISKRSDRGYFEVLVDRAHSTVEASSFNHNLDTLALGDEIAFKGGRHRLNYMGAESIYGISVAASHLGIAPALSLLRGVLGDRRSAVEDSELLWLNEDEEDFVCGEDVEALEYRHIEKLAVSRIVEEDLYASAFAKSEAIQEAIMPYDEGRLGVICAPDYIVPGLRKLFQDLGYPSDNILTVPIA
jgi:ferredoxin-NADP reductase